MNRMVVKVSAALLNGKLNKEAIIQRLERKEILHSQMQKYLTPDMVRVSTAHVTPRLYTRLEDYVDDMESYVRDAADSGAHLVVFPELCGLTPLLLMPGCSGYLKEIRDRWDPLEPLGAEALKIVLEETAQLALDASCTLFSQLAGRFGLYICMGSIPLPADHEFTCRSFLFGPDGKIVLEQEKLYPSPWEKALGVRAGTFVETADTLLGRVAILMGDDARFYEPFKIAKQMGVQIALCPSLSINRPPAYQKAAALMRVQENAMIAVQSSFEGNLCGIKFTGSSGIYCPYDLSRTRDGIMAQSFSDSGQRTLTVRLDLPRLGSYTDLYSMDVNPQLSQQLVDLVLDHEKNDEKEGHNP